jgi:hypothetical protein
MNLFEMKDLVHEIASTICDPISVKRASRISHLFYHVLRYRIRYGEIMRDLRKSFVNDVDSLYIVYRCTALKYTVTWWIGDTHRESLIQKIDTKYLALYDKKISSRSIMMPVRTIKDNEIK